MHANQLHVTQESVRLAIAEQFPKWAKQEIKELQSEGTANFIFRIGPSVTARFPLHVRDPDVVQRSLDAEVAAARELTQYTAFPLPQPMGIGRPGPHFPLPWLLQTWLPGESMTGTGSSGSIAFAQDLSNLIKDVRSVPVAGRTFTGTGRGGNLRDHDDWMNICFERSEDLLDVTALRQTWQAFRELPPHSKDTMTHGDLTPGNVLLKNGRLCGILDFASFGAADPALDLVSAWHMLDAEARSVLRSELQCPDLEWERGKAWAFQQAMGLVWYYAKSNPAMSRLGRRALERLSADQLLEN